MTARHDGKSREGFCLARGSLKQLIRWLAHDPVRDCALRLSTHGLGEHVGIEYQY